MHKNRSLISLIIIKTAILNSYLIFYVMTSTGIDLYDIVHVKVDFIPGLKICVLPILGNFVWTTSFAQCVWPYGQFYLYSFKSAVFSSWAEHCDDVICDSSYWKSPLNKRIYFLLKKCFKAYIQSYQVIVHPKCLVLKIQPNSLSCNMTSNL